MTAPSKVLIIDDSVVVRKAVSDALSNDPEIQIVGTASNGKIALQRIAQYQPDVLILDIEMPEADGFFVLRSIRRDYPSLRTIMFSSLTQHGAAKTIESLSMGADDYVSKPSGPIPGGYQEAIQKIALELIPKIKQFRPQSFETRAPHPLGLSKDRGPRVQPEVLAIGISTGGPEALGRVLPRLPEDFRVPIVIVQHMPPVFTRLLAERIDLNSKIKAVEAKEGMLIESGVAYFAPGDYHMGLEPSGGQAIVRLTKSPPENSCRPAVDVLFRSVAKVYGPRAIGLIMTGMGQDGLIGVQEMKQEGATILAQDEKSSVVWGMPAAVVREGLADSVVHIDDLVDQINRYVSSGVLAGKGKESSV